MTVLYCVNSFPIGKAPVVIESRLPQPAFPEYRHDSHEIVVAEHGTRIHAFNGQPYTISGGMVRSARDHDRYLYEHADSLCLTNVLYRSPSTFQFLTGLNQLLPQEQSGQYLPHWQVNQGVLQQVRQLMGQMEALDEGMDTLTAASREVLFMQLLVLLRKSSPMEAATGNDARLNLLTAWLEDNFADEVCWEVLVEKFSLSLHTPHRQLKQQTGLTSQRYLNRLRLTKAWHSFCHSDDSVTDIAYLCGFSDSNHFSMFSRRESRWSSRDIRQGCDLVVASHLQ